MNRFFHTSLLIVVVVGISNLCVADGHAQTAANSDSAEAKLGVFVERLIERYDKNEDGELQEGEVAIMRRKPQGADANEDGTLSKKELVVHFKTGIRRAGLSPEEQKKLSDKEEAEKAAALKSDSAPLTVDIFTLRASDDSPLEKLATNLRGESAKSVEQMLRAVRRDEELACDYDAMQFTLNWNQEFRLRVGSQVPVVDGVSYGRDGRAYNNISKFSVGTRLLISASHQNNDHVLKIDFDKSSAFKSDTVLFEDKSGEKTYGETIGNVELGSEFAFEKDKANVFSMTDSGSTWILVVVAR